MPRMVKNGALCVFLGMILSFGVIILGFGGFDSFVHASKFASVLRIIERNFVGGFDLDDITDRALLSAVDSLDDDWSYYMDAENYADYLDYSANRYQGIGVTIFQDTKTGGFVIQALTRNGPAHRAGLAVGDIILAVDDTSVIGRTSDDLRDLIQKDFGKDAVITVLGEDGMNRDVAVSCEEVYTSPVTYQLLSGHVGYVAISNFRDRAGSEAIAAVDDLLSLGADSFIFDVRNNPGGQVSEMNAILDHLLPEGDLFIRTDKHGREEVDKSDESCVQLPMAVIVNGESYSAAEFFAAALHDYDWAVTVGNHTSGKARSQITLELWDGSAVHISKYSYLTPSRTDLYETKGLKPDVEAELSEEETADLLNGWLDPSDDPQVQAALNSLAGA